jgi:D-threo-aldose 1-dehydrogenase
VRLPHLGLGGGPLGNLFHAISDEQAHDTVDAAWRAGIRYFDTAPHYGLGLAERRLGAALRHRPREEYIVSTKVGRLLVPNPPGAHPRDPDIFDVPATHRRVWDFSRDGVRRSLDDSLIRLNLDGVDVLFLHDAGARWRQALDHGYPALAELRAAGVVRAIGAGMNDAALLARLVRHADPDIVMLAGRYTLLDQTALDDLLPLCLERGVRVVAVALLHGGQLAHPHPDDPRARRIADVCARHGVPLAAAALRFPLRHPAVTSVVVGCHTAEQVRRNTALFSRPVPEELWADLAAHELIPPSIGPG